MLSYPNATNGVHVSQGCALTHFALVAVIVTNSPWVERWWSHRSTEEFSERGDSRVSRVD